MWDSIKPEKDKKYHLFVSALSFEDSLQPSEAHPNVNKRLKPPTSNKHPKILSTPKATNQINHEVRKSPRLNLNPTVPTTLKTKKQRVVVSEVRKSPRLNHVPSTTPTIPKAPNQTIVQLRKLPRLHLTPTTPMEAKKLYFEAEVEDCDGGVSEDDEVDMFIQVGDEYGHSIKLSTAYVSEPSSDEEDVDFVPNPIDKDSESEELDLVDEQPNLDGDNNDEDADISAFVKLPKNLYADEEHERIEGNGTTELKNYVETHTCEADGKNKNAQATCGWVADKLEGFLRSHPQMKPKDLILEVLDKFGVDISYYAAWKAKVRVLERINGNYEASYHKIA
ncbi:hypothetical protein IFM89_029020 [Coptis chinensis]|uniref:Transposase n=1 Tax=Coptis chinensis TaxID=261450 RepID=A0A835IFL2_9MAGN|nr:hypothetical protein IFM89_029020 [Coptis chinensis]